LLQAVLVEATQIVPLLQMQAPEEVAVLVEC
jgi:hypothetical protein